MINAASGAKRMMYLVREDQNVIRSFIFAKYLAFRSRNGNSAGNCAIQCLFLGLAVRKNASV
jgi:hypothetical protein